MEKRPENYWDNYLHPCKARWSEKIRVRLTTTNAPRRYVKILKLKILKRKNVYVTLQQQFAADRASEMLTSDES